MVTLLVAVLILIIIVLSFMYAAEKVVDYIDELRQERQDKHDKVLDVIFDNQAGDPLLIADPRFQ